jgi:hypothetical protein
MTHGNRFDRLERLRAIASGSASGWVRFVITAQPKTAPPLLSR